MVCIPIAWVAPSHQFLLRDSLEGSSADGPLAAASVPSVEQSVVLTQNGLEQAPKVEIKPLLCFRGCDLPLVRCCVFEGFVF